MCLGVEFFGFILFKTLWVSWNWMSDFFPKSWKFSAMNSSDNFSASFFLSWTSKYTCYSTWCYPIHCISYLWYFLFFSALSMWVLMFCLPAHWFIFLFQPVYWWTLQVYFFSSVIVLFSSVTSIWYFLIFSFSLLKFLMCSSIIPLNSMNIFITLNSLSSRLLSLV